MKNNNAGISIVEVIVVVAIIVILASGAIYGIGQVSGFRAREGADTIATSVKQARIQVLGKAKSHKDMAWELYKKDNSFYVRTACNLDSTPYYVEEKKIVDGTVQVSVGTAASQSELTATIDSPYQIFFNRSTGAVCDGSGNTVAENPYIVVKHGNKDYYVEIVAKTGKIITNTVKKK